MTTPIQATIDVRPDTILGEVHDHLYGANIEHLGQTVYGGSWAEMLRDRKFAGADMMYQGLSEGLSHQYPAFGVVVPWEPVNPDFHDVLFVHDNTTFYTGRQSQRITVRRDDGRQRGIRQSGLHLEAGRGYQLRLVLKGEGQSLAVQLGDASWTIPALPAAWTTFERTLTPATSEATGALELTFRGGGSVWIGCASLMPDSHLGGHRADVVETPIGRFAFDADKYQDAPSGPSLLTIRPEQLRLNEAGSPGNVVTGLVRDRIYVGTYTRYKILLGDYEIEAIRSADTPGDIEEGSEVRVTFPSNRIWLVPPEGS